MNNQLKQRLVGAIVLVALAVIFIPMLLPGKGDLGSGIEGSNIPAEPDFRFPPVPVAPQAPPLAEAPAVPLGDAAETDAGKAVSQPPSDDKVSGEVLPLPKTVAEEAAPTKPAVKPSTKSIFELPSKADAAAAKAKPSKVGGWVIQVGSFSARGNAQALRDKLRKQGYVSFVESIKGQTGRVYRVRVGPELTKQAAETLRQRLTKEAGLKGLVQAYP